MKNKEDIFVKKPIILSLRSYLEKIKLKNKVSESKCFIK